MDLGVFEIGLPAADITKSVDFYEALGFARTEPSGEAHAATLIRGDCRIGLYQGGLDPARPHLMFRQGDVDALAAAALRNGLSSLNRLNTDHHSDAFMLRDPDAHPLHFIRRSASYPRAPRPAPLMTAPRLGWFELSLPVAEMARSVAFYEALAFEEVLREPSGTRVTLQNADCRIGLFQGHLDPSRVQLIFWQGDLWALADEIRREGLEFFRGPSGQSDHATFMLRDPDGHPLFFIRMPGVVRAA